ncbi:SRPBCC family protein [Planococcus sp. ISL-110]|uniref:SRPBCC family protein n=1 Tax=Planococcus sp. ISL-110 TaxID=2819167 RepID=UPI001BEBDEFD|nr:SRPBCC family protein [Planococcus sp. ISL-110]MBT2571208.1 SRPBCC family protein [Planococcus sp. ISL-110]
MIAEVTRNQQGYVAEFDRKLVHEPEKVWQMLTDNQKIHRWFAGLQIEQPGKDGYLTFDLGHGKFEKMAITDYEEKQQLGFEWGKDHVLFELMPEEGGTRLRMVETIHALTDQTPKDVAGWHVCLDVLEALLDKRGIERTLEWEHWYPEYKRLFESMRVSSE